MEVEQSGFVNDSALPNDKLNVAVPLISQQTNYFPCQDSKI